MGTLHQSRIGAHVVLLEIDNPPANTLGREMRVEFRQILSALEADYSVRALILTGRGKAFCSGDDLKEQQQASHLPAPERAALLADFHAMLNQVEAFRAPVIAALNGWAVGGGLELALCCDIRLASQSAKLTCAGVNVGLIASAYRLPRLIGVARAKQMLLTGLPFEAAQAEQFGLVSAVYPSASLMEQALALAARIASRAPLSIEASKKMADQAADLLPDMAARQQLEILAELAQSADHKAALVAFGEKREPVFSRG